MKKMTKKWVAFLLMLCMVFSWQGMVALAEGMDSPVDISEEDPETEQVDVVNSNEAGQVDQSGLGSTTGGDESDQTDEGMQAGDVLLNYLCVGEVKIQTPQEETILVSLGTGEEELSNLTVSITKDDGTIEEIPAIEKDGNIYRFVREYNDSEKGVYSITHVSYEVSGQKKVIDLESIGIHTLYGVDMDIPSDDMEEDTVEVSIASVEGSNVQKGAAEVAATLEESMEESITSASRSRANASVRSFSKLVVMLDPGHGGWDPGASGNGLTESDLTLKIARYAKQELEEYFGVQVYMTREDDRYVDLTERAELAAQKGANILVSIHMNSAGSSDANGAEVWYPNSSYNSSVHEAGKAVAQQIQNKLVEAGLGNRGIKFLDATDGSRYDDGSIMDYYSVIRNSKLRGIPGIIVEHGFLTNASDAGKFKNEAFLQKLGIADATGIAQYYGLSKVNFSELFDFDYYVNKYSDINAVYGNDEQGAFEHFINFGMKEKRQGCSSFDVVSYKNRYPDLRLAFEDDYPSYYAHYIATGKAEGRVATGTVTMVPITSYNGTKYSDVYEYEYYMDKYSDLRAKYSDNDAGALKHFIEFGMREGRQAKEEFNVNYYRDRYSDLRAAFGNDSKAYYLHYITKGKAEGRNAKDAPAITVYKGKDYSLVYDYEYYIENNSDVKKVYGEKPDKVLEHFVVFGIREGRQAHKDFDVKSYRNKYQDLRLAYGKDFQQYFDHYMTFGNKEGRIATGVPSISSPITRYNGINYSSVYDFNYYIENHSDLKKIYSDDDIGALEHFVVFGMREGRRANSNFDVRSYRNKYVDLRIAFRNNWSKYYEHYIDFGKKEGRVATGVDSLENAVTKYQGKNYSAVYDFNYYIENHSDLKKIYSDDDIGALEHFITFGMREGRQASEKFNINVYRDNYLDLRRAFGSNNVSYYLHYIDFGKSEGRNATEGIYYTIMGNSSTTVSQMVKYYNVNATYPLYYREKDAKTIEEFCKIYDEECKAEGVKTEVAFCQAMKETGFLRFGGDVKIEQLNFAGLGATGNGEPGNTFTSVRIGIRAQIQHLKAYASEEKLNYSCVDERFKYVTRGCAPYVEWLGIKENPTGKGWAAAEGYGYSMINDYIKKLLSY